MQSDKKRKVARWRKCLLTAGLLLAAVIIIAGIVVISRQIKYRDVIRTLVVEAGTPMPEANAFFMDDRTGATYQDASIADLKQPGDYPLVVLWDGGEYEVIMKVQDTVTPTAQAVRVELMQGGSLEPSAFVTNIEDATSVWITFESKPDFNSLGEQEVVILLTDTTGNVGRIHTQLTIATVKEQIVLEAGEPIPNVERFILADVTDRQVSIDTAGIDTTVPGAYPVVITIDGTTYTSTVLIEDTEYPKVRFVERLELTTAENIDPAQFVASVEEVTAVQVYYRSAPELTSTQWQQVTICVEDAGGNVVTGTCALRISKLLETVSIEADGQPVSVSVLLKPELAAEITADLPVFAQDGTVITADQVGTFSVSVPIEGISYVSTLTITDTVAPVGTVQEVSAIQGAPLKPEQFFKEITDCTQVTASYVGTEPDLLTVGTQSVCILLRDSAGNEQSYDTALRVTADTTAPKIYGAKNKSAYINNTVSYKKGVYTSDNSGGEVVLTVDISQVNQRVVGDYPAIYTATDPAGNTSTEEITIYVREISVSMDELNQMADDILAEITTEDMDLVEKAWAIYQYTENIAYVKGGSDKDDFVKEAYRGMTTMQGDCYTTWAVNELLLTRVGIETMEIQRTPGLVQNTHFWHLINCGDGWYFFDSSYRLVEATVFMWTNQQLREYALSRGGGGYHFAYDKSKYPDTPKQQPEEAIALLKAAGRFREE